MKVEKKQNSLEKEKILSSLREFPIVNLACKKSGVSRATYYRWRIEDSKFFLETEKAMEDGIENVNDMTESKLMSLIKDNNFPAISLWLRKNHKRFSDNIYFGDKDVAQNLSSSQKESVKKCLRFLS